MIIFTKHFIKKKCDSYSISFIMLFLTGLPWLFRKMIANSKPDMELEALECDADGEPVLIHQLVKTPIKNRELKFRIGEPFEEKSPNGKTVRVRISPRLFTLALTSRDHIIKDRVIVQFGYTYRRAVRYARGLGVSPPCFIFKTIGNFLEI